MPDFSARLHFRARALGHSSGITGGVRPGGAEMTAPATDPRETPFTGQNPRAQGATASAPDFRPQTSGAAPSARHEAGTLPDGVVSVQDALAAMQAELRSLRIQIRGRSSPRQVLSLREAARQLGIDRNRTLKALLASGQVRTVQVNGKKKIPASEVDRLAQHGFDTSRTVAKPRAPRRKAPATGIRSIEL